MYSAFAAFLVALLAGALLTPLVRKMAIRLEVLDRPSLRHIHEAPIPRLGGVAVVAAFFAPLPLLFLGGTAVWQLFEARPLLIVGLGIGAVAMCGLGLLDDLRGVRAWHKLWVQTAVAVVAFACGYRIDTIVLPWVGPLQMGVFAAPVTVLWIVAIINAFNLIDGLDGLAAGIAFFACVANFTVALIHGPVLVMLLSAALAGAIVGFLLYNFNPASIFMGDSGSMFLGFVLATTSLLGNAVKSSTAVAILVPVLALGVPIMDTLFTMARRFLERRPIFSPDRGHIHHRLLDLGLTHRRAVLVLYALSIVFTGAAIVVALGREVYVGLALIVFSVAAFAVVRWTGYFQHFKALGSGVVPQSEMTNTLRRSVPPALQGLARSSTLEEMVKQLEEFAASANMLQLDLRLGTDGSAVEHRWRVPVQNGRNRTRMVNAKYALDEQGTQSLCFGWDGDEQSISPDINILLQLIADACSSKLPGNACEDGGASTGPTASA